MHLLTIKWGNKLVHETGNSLGNGVSPATKPQKRLGLVSLLGLENWLNLVQVKARFQIPVGGREIRREERLRQARGGGGTSPRARTACLKVCSSFSRKPGGSPLLSGLMAISQKKQLPEDKPRVRRKTGKKLVWNTGRVSPLHSPPVKREQ